MGAPAEQPPDRLAERLAVDIPERDVDRRIAAHLGAGIARADIDAAQRAVVQLDVARILADQIGGDIVVDVAGDRTRRPEGLAGADDAGIGVDAQPEQERKFGQLQRFERRRLSLLLPPRALELSEHTIACAVDSNLWYRYQIRQDSRRGGLFLACRNSEDNASQGRW